MEIVDPKNLPFDPDTSPRDEHIAFEEPVDETSRRLFASLTDAISALPRYLRQRGGAAAARSRGYLRGRGRRRRS